MPRPSLGNSINGVQKIQNGWMSPARGHHGLIVILHVRVEDAAQSPRDGPDNLVAGFVQLEDAIERERDVPEDVSDECVLFAVHIKNKAPGISELDGLFAKNRAVGRAHAVAVARADAAYAYPSIHPPLPGRAPA